MYIFFFFKQKTAYEMRISDWSSDVCSSDLGLCDGHAVAGDDHDRAGVLQQEGRVVGVAGLDQSVRRCRTRCAMRLLAAEAAEQDVGERAVHRVAHDVGQDDRSEEHTSVLQSLMRISYAVFCLKKHNQHNQPNTTNDST